MDQIDTSILDTQAKSLLLQSLEKNVYVNSCPNPSVLVRCTGSGTLDRFNQVQPVRPTHLEPSEKENRKSSLFLG